jgi:RNA polymerase sigma-70 factor (ECF subfamily)
VNNDAVNNDAVNHGAVNHDAIERAYREEWGCVLATLIRTLGDFDLAEEALQEAFTAALETWPRDGVPEVPAAWLLAVSRRKAIDRLRREKRRRGDDATLEGIPDGRSDPIPAIDERLDQSLGDDRLRLIFTCCHPALAREAQVALTLRTLGGLETEEIARAFLLPKETLAQRLVRAKKKIREARIPYRVPSDDLLPERLPAVLAVVYLIFNEGYAASSGGSWIRGDLCEEAIRLSRLLLQLMPGEPEVFGLAALVLLQHSRCRARVADDGVPVLLEDQDRGQWDRTAISEGVGYLLRARELAVSGPGSVQLQAEIAAVHAEASLAEDTDWLRIVLLYDALLALHDSPVIALNRAAAIAMAEGPEAGLAEIDRVAAANDLEEYRYLHSARGELLRRLGRSGEARTAFERARDLTENDAERRHLDRRLAE